MSSKDYDIAIVGGTLSARIAATLFAKQGNRVLFIRQREAQAPAWFHSSLFLEKLLGLLGGRSCFVSPHPIQVISTRSRVTLCNDSPLEAELDREFGANGSAANRWLSELNDFGTRLEELFWDNGGLPWPSFRESARFKLLCLRRRIKLSQLEQPVGHSLDKLGGPARTFLTDLLQGLSLRSINELTYAKAAMLWAQAMRPENLQEPDFSTLLNKRFEQFHGAKADIEDLEALDYHGSHWTGGHFKEGGRFTARTFLLGDMRWVDLFAAGRPTLTDWPPAPSSWQTGDLGGQLSPLLATRVICGGCRPVRISIDELNGTLQGLVLSSSGATVEEIRNQLEPALPFAHFHLREDSQNESFSKTSAACRQLADLPIRIGSNLYCVDRAALLPEMGAAGAALLAWTVAMKLGERSVVGKG